MNINAFNEALLDNIKKEGYAGYDPFDGLNSKYINWSETLKNSLFGLAWIQFFKRSPVNFRKFALVPKKRNPKGIGLIILGLVNDYLRTGKEEYREEAVKLGDWLLDECCDKAKWGFYCWGYHFDWKAKAFFVPKGKPNVITTIYVAQALYRLFEISKYERYREASFDSAGFIFKHLLREDDIGPYVAYIPGEEAFVHNASLWGAAWLAFVGKEVSSDEYRNVALSVARRSVKEQKVDGSWVYGAMPHHQFIDGFHTGYNLEALSVIATSLDTNELDPAIEKGLEYYEKVFFTESGTAKYYNDNKYPLDMHSVSQAIITLLKIMPTISRKRLVEKVIKKSFDELFIESEGRFAYQRTASGLNAVNYTRWTQAWVYYSFSFYLLEMDKSDRN